MSNSISNSLHEAAALLSKAMPEFSIDILPPYEHPSDVFGVDTKHPKLAVELPQSQGDLLFTLIDKLTEISDLWFMPDSRAPYAACTFNCPPDKVFDAVDINDALARFNEITLAALRAASNLTDRHRSRNMQLPADAEKYIPSYSYAPGHPYAEKTELQPSAPAAPEQVAVTTPAKLIAA